MNATLVWLALPWMWLVADDPTTLERVVVRPRGEPSAPTTTYTGEIEESLGTRVVVREQSGRRVRNLSLDEYEVVELAARLSEKHRQGVAAFGAGDWGAAETALADALETEPRRWVRREILVVRCRVALAREDHLGACTHFLKVYESDPATPSLRLIPLKWTGGAGDPAVVRAARDWIDAPSAIARLMGASHLLEEPGRSEEAVATLSLLSRHDDRRIATLAGLQLLRRDLAGNTLSDLQLERRRQQVWSLGDDFRGGASFLLGRALAARSQAEAAAAAFLWPATTGRAEGELAARGLLEAGSELNQVGQTGDAIRLWREVVARFPKTSWSQEAADLERQAREQLAK